VYNRTGPYINAMCGRITQKSNPHQLGLRIVNLIEPLYAANTPPRYNGAPGQEHWIIRKNPDRRAHAGSVVVGIDPVLDQGRKGGRKPINAKSETVATLPTFRDAYQKRRCILPVDNFFEWKAFKGAKAKQP